MVQTKRMNRLEPTDVAYEDHERTLCFNQLLSDFKKKLELIKKHVEFMFGRK